MMTKHQFDIWCINNQITTHAKTLIEKIRNRPPVRRVRSGTEEVGGTYASMKMVQSIQFQSHTVELPFIYQKEHDPNVLEYYDQPSQLRLDYVGIVGDKQKRKTFLYTPDYFVIRQNGAEFVECKTEDDLVKLSNKDPRRYHQDENGTWLCPPGEACAKQFKLQFTVFCSSQIDRGYL